MLLISTTTCTLTQKYILKKSLIFFSSRQLGLIMMTINLKQPHFAFSHLQKYILYLLSINDKKWFIYEYFLIVLGHTSWYLGLTFDSALRKEAYGRTMWSPGDGTWVGQVEEKLLITYCNITSAINIRWFIENITLSHECIVNSIINHVSSRKKENTNQGTKHLSLL